ncbi:unnamed protein product [Ceutorhynchus assimilis]|uniref:Protein kinase domain-containing protein n=1 Tax=Ceutorhynchus assimilis TaxID=467358 RepID=A0A9N9MVK3_9CUCU|nr:unnamed protein product [Ceutorhynchus assimilis]
MANSLKHLLISPTFLSPLSPSRNLASFPRFPKSEGDKIFIRQITRPKKVAKKLDFSQTKENFIARSSTNLPDIRIVDDTRGNVQQKLRQNHILNINTPVKLDLVKNGLEKFKNSTTVLGKGTFGTVFKGSHRGETVAVKIATKECSSREQNALNLSHKNIVKTLEIVQNAENNYQTYSLIIMEYLPKCKSLQEVLENLHEENSSTLEQFAIDITSGLDYLHKNGVLHLDLKPKNILLVEPGNICKICDFGNSARIDDNLANFSHNGTVIYTAPEILLGKPPSVKSDIYSLGLVFWQIVYQKNPFCEYDTMESIIYNVSM